MGRNGAGKSTLLKAIAGLIDPTRGRIRAGRTALLTQHPGDHLMHETIGADVPDSELAQRHPRDVSGGERQRSALQLVLDADAELLLLDEPTRGMDPRAPRRARRRACASARASSPPTTPSSRPRSPPACSCSATAARSPTPSRTRCWPAAGTSPPRSPACSGAPAARSHPRRAPRSSRTPGARMSWIAGSTLILGAVLLVGFVWYERTHPTTRVIALVATLAAMAALGRVAFAALPNVKPTTDIVLIAGYTLGGAPGFMVGAVAALASNLFFGQGPWTPWQMAAWGGVGLFGAALARIKARPRPDPPGRGLRVRGPGLRRGHEPEHVGDLLGRPHDGQAGGLQRLLAALRRRPRHRQRRLLPGLRPGAGPSLASLSHALRHHLAPA